MRCSTPGFTLFLFLFGLSLRAQNLELKNGNWFVGAAFEKRERVFVGNGVFADQRPDRVDSTIDLSGTFIIPPFAEVHTHNLGSSYGLEEIIEQYLEEGTFYVQVLGCSHRGRLEALPYLNDPHSIDVVYSNGGITSTMGHPFLIYEPLAMEIYDPAEKKDRYDEILNSRLALNDAYWFFDSKKAVDAHWAELMATRPDVIKIMLIEAEDFLLHQEDSSRIGKKGLSPDVAAYVVKKAHENDLPVYAHIATPSDFRLGLDIGVDVFAHMPGYVYGGVGSPEKYALTPYDFQKAKAKGVAIIPTAYLALRRLPRGEGTDREKALEQVIAFQSSFFEQAIHYGIPMGLGSDDFGETLMKEVDYLYQHRLLTEAQLLMVMCVSGPQLCFPERKIGRLEVGYEGSFLVLGRNPLVDFEAIRDIGMRVKEGVVLGE